MNAVSSAQYISVVIKVTSSITGESGGRGALLQSSSNESDHKKIVGVSSGGATH